MLDHAWRNLAEDAVNDLFKSYVQDQMLAVIRSQIDIETLKTNVVAARDKRATVLEALNSL